MPPSKKRGNAAAPTAPRKRTTRAATAAAAASAVSTPVETEEPFAPADTGNTKDRNVLPEPPTDTPVDIPPESSASAQIAEQAPQKSILADAQQAPDPSSATDFQPVIESEPATASKVVDPRLESLRGGTTATRGSKRTIKQPSFRGRRSKEERDAAERAEATRRRQAIAEQGRKDAAAARARAAARGRGGDRGRGRGRGGFGSDLREPSGPFGGGFMVHDNAKHRVHVSSSRSFREAGASGRVKNEPNVKDDPDADIKLTGVQYNAGDDEYSSGDDTDDSEAGPRMNIDFIHLLSSSSSSEEGRPLNRGKRGTSTLSNHDPTYAPVRVPRTEHKPRVINIYTETSSANSSKEDGFEVTRAQRKWRGMWSDSEDEDDAIIVKPEPREKVTITDAPEMILEPSKQAEVPEDEVVPKEPPSSPELGKKPLKPKQDHNIPGHDQPPFVIETEKDKAEWARIQQDQDKMVRELSGGLIKKPDKDGDTNMGDGEQQRNGRDQRSDHVYLFQFPPMMPDLSVATDDKGENNSAAAPSTAPSASAPTVAPGTTSNAPAPISTPGAVQPSDVKGEVKADPNLASVPGPTLADKPRLASGFLGKMRVHQSGRTTMEWGGTSFEVNSGVDASYLQDAVVVGINPPEERVSEADGGDVKSLGPVKEKFVVSLDWETT
ncbi:hypothetical protein M501DRAFT_1017149 [Patellaria atrata CBS 101060]|uniref:Uncharacterized protein n=1 Tax=Patellaria atrata CBS 101060 TaxID=1346257 RepID=A0A9P4VNV7_9PEZI|nr:hypothetical protein M501DRAFT_1017149 [Patellaria atrata CBS 101060]